MAHLLNLPNDVCGVVRDYLQPSKKQMLDRRIGILIDITDMRPMLSVQTRFKPNIRGIIRTVAFPFLGNRPALMRGRGVYYSHRIHWTDI